MMLDVKIGFEVISTSKSSADLKEVAINDSGVKYQNTRRHRL